MGGTSWNKALTNSQSDRDILIPILRQHMDEYGKVIINKIPLDVFNGNRSISGVQTEVRRLEQALLGRADKSDHFNIENIRDVKKSNGSIKRSNSRRTDLHQAGFKIYPDFPNLNFLQFIIITGKEKLHNPPSVHKGKTLSSKLTAEFNFPVRVVTTTKELHNDRMLKLLIVYSPAEINTLTFNAYDALGYNEIGVSTHNRYQTGYKTKPTVNAQYFSAVCYVYDRILRWG